MNQRILVLAGFSDDIPVLHLDMEARTIQESFAGKRGVEVFTNWISSPGDFGRAVLKSKPQLIHFSGGSKGAIGLVFQDEAGHQVPASPESLSAFFSLFPDVKCVFMSNCFSELQAKAVGRHVRHVVGTSASTDDIAHMNFVTGFYSGIAEGESVDFSYRFAQTFSELKIPASYLLAENQFTDFPRRVESVDLTPQVIRLLSEDPSEIYKLSYESFESLICNRLDNMGFDPVRVGSGSNHRDGGIDIIACPRNSVVPFVMAVQVKHVDSPRRKIGSPPVRDFLGAVELHNLNAGLLVTNTTFTADARWIAERRPFMLNLRDIEDLRHWLRDKYVRQLEWRGLPERIEVCPGVWVKLPW